MKNRFIFLIFTVLTTSCFKEKVNDKQINFSFSKQSKETIAGIVKNYTIIPLETIDDIYLTNARKILMKDDKIYILDIMGRRHQIYIFNDQGKFVSKINSQGRGGKEYQSISDFDIHPNKEVISILDPGLRKLMNFNLNSEYQNEQKLDCWAKEFKYMNNNKHIYYVFTTKSSKSANGVGNDMYIYDDDFRLIYSALPFDKPLGMAIGNGINLMSIAGGVNYYKPNSNIIYSIGFDSLSIKYNLHFPFDVLPGEEIENAFLRGKNILHKYVYNVIYIEAANTIYTLFMHNKEVYFGIYGKQSKESLVFNEQKDPSCGCGITLNVKGTFNNSFILETDISKINGVLKMLDPGKAKCLNPEVFDIIKGLDMTSNPILILVEFKI